MKFTSIVMQEIRQQVADHGEWALKWDITMNLSTRTPEGAGMFPKDISILLTHNKAMELWETLHLPSGREYKLITQI